MERKDLWGRALLSSPASHACLPPCTWELWCVDLGEISQLPWALSGTRLDSMSVGLRAHVHRMGFHFHFNVIWPLEL